MERTKEEGEKIAQVAMTYLRTPYRDHAAIKGVGVDCATLARLVYQEAGIIPQEYVHPYYSPQQWLIRGEDRTFLMEVQQFADEITEAELLPGDLILYKVLRSWTHGGIVIEWPTKILHAMKGTGVVLSNETQDGFLGRRERRYFRMRGPK